MAEMTEARARELIAGVKDRADGCWLGERLPSTFVLDGSYTADELEAFAWWLRNKTGEEP